MVPCLAVASVDLADGRNRYGAGSTPIEAGNLSNGTGSPRSGLGRRAHDIKAVSHSAAAGAHITCSSPKKHFESAS